MSVNIETHYMRHIFSHMTASKQRYPGVPVVTYST